MPFTAKQPYNSRWPPHAKFTFAQGRCEFHRSKQEGVSEGAIVPMSSAATFRLRNPELFWRIREDYLARSDSQGLGSRAKITAESESPERSDPAGSSSGRRPPIIPESIDNEPAQGLLDDHQGNFRMWIGRRPDQPLGPESSKLSPVRTSRRQAGRPTENNSCRIRRSQRVMLSTRERMRRHASGRCW